MGPLKVRISGGTDGEGGGTGSVVVLMHGFGAPGTDLVGLGSALGAPTGTRFVFPEAPIELGMPFGDARAWWMVDVERIQRAAMTGGLAEVRREVPPGLADAQRGVEQMLDALEASLGASKLVLGGFSQGAITAVDVALHTDRPLAGLVLFSGALLASDRWMPRLSTRAGLPVFQSHGTMDPVLPFPLATDLHETLKTGGLDAAFTPFVGMHEIGTPALVGASRFLNDAL